MATTSSWVRRIRQELRFLRAILRDPRTPPAAKWLIGAGVAYLISPIDLVPDVIPVIGQLDDVLIVPTLVALGLATVPQSVKRDHRRRTSSISRGRFAEQGAMRFETEALPGSFGVRVVDVDTGSAHGTEILLGLLELVLDHRVVVSNGLVGEELLGPLGRDFEFLSKGERDLEAPLPDALASRFQIEITSGKGEAQFVDLIAAYEALPERHKQAIDGLMVWPHRVEKRDDGSRLGFRHLAIGEPRELGYKAGMLPLAPRHPVTGARSLAPSLSDCSVVGMSKEKSADLLAEIREHVQQPEFRCAHQFGDGDVITRDEVSTGTSNARPPRDVNAPEPQAEESGPHPG